MGVGSGLEMGLELVRRVRCGLERRRGLRRMVESGLGWAAGMRQGSGRFGLGSSWARVGLRMVMDWVGCSWE